MKIIKNNNKCDDISIMEISSHYCHGSCNCDGGGGGERCHNACYMNKGVFSECHSGFCYD